MAWRGVRARCKWWSLRLPRVLQRCRLWLVPLRRGLRARTSLSSEDQQPWRSSWRSMMEGVVWGAAGGSVWQAWHLGAGMGRLGPQPAARVYTR